jgi:hypothetical protein
MGLLRGPGGADGRRRELGGEYVRAALDVVEAHRSKARAEVEANWEAIRERIQAAFSGTSESTFCIQDETEEVRAAFEATKRLGCLAHLGLEEVEQEEKAAGTGEAETMASVPTFVKQVLGCKATAEVARTLLVQTAVWHVHQNLEVLRQRIPMEFSPSLERHIDADERLDLMHLPAFAIDEGDR